MYRGSRILHGRSTDRFRPYGTSAGPRSSTAPVVPYRLEDFSLMILQGNNANRTHRNNNSRPITYFIDVLRNDDSEQFTELIIELDLDVNQKISPTGQTLLHMAAEHNSANVARVLLENGADPFPSGKLGLTPLLVAMYHRSMAVAYLLIDHSDDVVKRSRIDRPTTLFPGLTLFHDTTFIDKDLMLKLYAAGFNVDIRDFQMNTPLHCAVNLEYFRFLVDNGADVNAQNSEGRTPLHLAFVRNKQDIAFYILACCNPETGVNANAKSKPSIDIRDEWCKTPLVCAYEALDFQRNDIFIFGIPDGWVNDKPSLNWSCQDEVGNRVEYNNGWIKLSFSERNDELTSIVRATAGKYYTSSPRGSKPECFSKFDESGKTVYVGAHRDKCITTDVDIYHEWLHKIDNESWLRLVNDRRPPIDLDAVRRQMCLVSAIPDIRMSNSCDHWQEYCKYRTEGDISHCCDSLLDTYLRCFEQNDPSSAIDSFDIQCGKEIVEKIWTDKEYCYVQRDIPTLHEAMLDVSKKFITSLLARVAEINPLFKGQMTVVGSAFEGTKITSPSEIDVNVELETLSEMCEVDSRESYPTGFVVLSRKADLNCKPKPEVFDENGMLLTSLVNYKFKSVVKSLLEDVTLKKQWEEEFGVKLASNSSKQNTTKLHETFSLDLTSAIVFPNNRSSNVSVDLVPVIRIPGWWPSDATPPDDNDMKTEGCCFVFDQPYEKYRIPYSPLQYARISFGRAEGLKLRKSPDVVRAAYMVAKHIVNLAQKWNASSSRYFMSSYAMKMAALRSIPDVTTSASVDGLTTDDIQWQVERVFLYCYQFALQDYVPSLFLPTFHSPVWPFEKTIKESHLCLFRLFGDNYRPYFSYPVLSGFFHDYYDVMRSLVGSYMLYALVAKRERRIKWFYPTLSTERIPCCDLSDSARIARNDV